MLGLLGMRDGPRRFRGASDQNNFNDSSTSSLVISRLVTITPERRRRGEVFTALWAQLEGPSAIVEEPRSLSTRFRLNMGYGTVALKWRCWVTNQYGDMSATDIAFTLTRYEPIPNLTGTGYPTSQQLVPINPTTRIGTCYFSVSVSGGVPPYSYNWNGGDFPTSASNQASFYLPPGSSSGIDFAPGCFITDSANQTLGLNAGPFFIYEAP